MGKIQEPTVFSRKSPQRSEGTTLMTFSEALFEAAAGKRVRKLEWKDEGVFITFQNDDLVLYRMDSKRFHALTVTKGDLFGDDWVLMNEPVVVDGDGKVVTPVEEVKDKEAGDKSI